jgi:hypothetical protein
MTEKRLSDALKVMESPQHDNNHKGHKLAKQLAFGAIGIAALSSIGAGIVNTQHADTDKNKDNDKSDTTKEKYEDIFKTVAKDKQKQVESADKAVQKLVKDDLNGKKDVHDANIKSAEDTIVGIKGDGNDLKSIRDAYTNIVNVVKSPTIDNLQKMRTSIANMSDSNISRHLNDTFESNMIKHVAEKTNKTVKEVTSESKPLTPQQVKVKEFEAKKKADAAQKADAQKAEAAPANSAPAPTSTPEAPAPEAQQASPAQQVSNQPSYNESPQRSYEDTSQNYGGGNTYTPPAQDNGVGNYTPPASAPTPTPAPAPTPTPAPTYGDGGNVSHGNGSGIANSPGGYDTPGDAGLVWDH